MDIMIQGEGKKFYKPTEVILNINFYANDTTYEGSLEKGTKAVEEFIKNVLNTLSINKDELKTRNFRISRNIHFDYQEKKNIDSGFDYNQNALLKFDYNMALVADFIDRVAQLDSPPKYNLTFSIKELEDAKKEVMTEAYNKAKEKAEIIALSAGKKLKDCIKVDFRPFEEKVYSNSRLANTDLLETNKMMKIQATKEIIQNTFTPEDIEIRETLYCLWITE